jgi:hypothetical protein
MKDDRRYKLMDFPTSNSLVSTGDEPNQDRNCSADEQR